MCFPVAFFRMQNILDQNLDMATALLAGEKLKELILPGSSQDEKCGMLAGLMVQLKLELPFDRVVTIGTVIIPILLVTLVFTRNFAGEALGHKGEDFNSSTLTHENSQTRLNSHFMKDTGLCRAVHLCLQ